MPTQIKICGITQLEEVTFLNETDVDYIGFVFAQSKRQISPVKAAELSQALRVGIKKCGIFVDHKVAEINGIAKRVGLDIAQIHRDFSLSEAAAIDIPVWYAVNIKDADSIRLANQAAGLPNVKGIVADSYVKGEHGGTGKTFNWQLLTGLDKSVFLILAGGLDAQNIEEAIKAASPDVADISSGAEMIINGKRMKSEEKVRELVRKVKAHG